VDINICVERISRYLAELKKKFGGEDGKLAKVAELK